MNKYRVLGENDDASECACCGRQGLRRVVWMQPLDENGEESGVPIPFGRVCAARAAGWGYSTTSSLERKIKSELAEATKHYQKLASDRIGELEKLGEIVQARVAYGFDYKSGTHNYGYIYVLPGDPIVGMTCPVAQTAEIVKSNTRRNERHPVCRCFNERLSLDELRRILSPACV